MDTQIILKKPDEIKKQGKPQEDIDDSTPDCNCKQHKIWHWCPFHNWCNPVTGVGV